MEVQFFERRELCGELVPSNWGIQYDSVIIAFVDRAFLDLHVFHALLTEQPPYIRASFIIYVVQCIMLMS